MKALALTPGKAGSGRIVEAPEPDSREGSILCDMIAVGVCGTDREIMGGEYGTAPEGEPYLIIGHESLGRVIEAPASSGLSRGDLVVGIVRRPDPVPCPSCARGQWDMCTNGLYTERGIKGLHGYCSERFRIEPEFAIRLEPHLKKVGVLLEPTSVVAKAWDHLERILGRAVTSPRSVLVTGAGPVGLLAAMIGKQKGYEVHILDHNTEGPKPQLARELGAIYHSDPKLLMGQSCERFDIMIECTGVPNLIFQLLTCVAPSGILCLTGVSSGGRKFGLDVGDLNREIVLQNEVVFGSVNANRRHFELAASALAHANVDWLEQIITDRVPLERWQDAFEKHKGEIKSVIVGPGE